MYSTDSLKIIIDSVKIVSQSTDKDWLSVEFISVVVAFFAVIIGPIIQIIIAKRQIKTQLEINKNQIKTQLEVNERQIKVNVLSKNRQEWIHMVRGNISEFISNAALLKMNKVAEVTFDESMFNLYEKLLRLEAIIKMLLSTKPEHEEFVSQMEKVALLAAKKDTDYKFNDGIRNLITSAKKILKEEWEKVKALE